MSYGQQEINKRQSFVFFKSLITRDLIQYHIKQYFT